MKLIIDIPKSIYEYMQTDEYDGHKTAYFEMIIPHSVKDGTPLPDNPTNGDMIKALFSIYKEKFTDYGTVKVYGVDSEKMPVEFLADWWNAPYKLSKLKGE